MRLLGLAMVLASGCYSPSVTPCRVACAGGMNGDCPQGLVCNGEAYCAGAATDSCQNAIADADLPDTSDPIDCGWSYVPSNVDPCALRVSESLLDFAPTGNVTIDTDALTTTFSSDKLLTANQSPGAEVAVLVVRSMSINMGLTVTVVGSRPLVILSQGEAKAVSALINVSPSEGMCPGSGGAGTDGTGGNGAGGGGGGGFGSVGGSGGTGGMRSSATPGGGASGGAPGQASSGVLTERLRPLRRGCSGGIGGMTISGNMVNGGTAGLGGGAIQISSAKLIQLSSGAAVIAGGGPGGNGGAAPGLNGGGGGGGAGGAILLEAPSLHLEGSSLCANGGGGGGSDPAGGSAEGGQCGPAGALPSAGGGAGATRAAAALMGGAGAGSSDMTFSGKGGGGGGGGVGRIRLNGALDVGPTTSTPAASLEPLLEPR